MPRQAAQKTPARKPAPKVKPKPVVKTKPAPTPVVEVSRTLVVRGEERMTALKAVKPNDWNPNAMSAFMFSSLCHDLEQTGWLRSMQILVWGKDVLGVEQNLIIDGEHRWKAGKKVGYKSVPMVWLDGITKAEAMRLTVKIRKQGDYNVEDLSTLLQNADVRAGMDLEHYSLDMGFDVDRMRELLGGELPTRGTQPTPVVGCPKVVLEFSNKKRRDAFKGWVARATEGAKTPGGDAVCKHLGVS